MNGDAETRPRTDRRASATRAGRYVVWSAADHTVSRRVWQTAPAPGRHDVGPAQERVETGRDAGMSRLSGIALLDSLSEEELAEFERQCRWQRHRKGDQIVERAGERSEEHTSELQSLMRISYAVFCLKKKNKRAKPQY